MTFVTIGGVTINLPILSYKVSSEILDSDDTGRSENWNLSRFPKGVIKNLDITFKGGYGSGTEVTKLINAIEDFGTTKFKSVTFVSPTGTITQDMYGTIEPYEIKIVERSSNVYWSDLTISLIAKKPYK